LRRRQLEYLEKMKRKKPGPEAEGEIIEGGQAKEEAVEPHYLSGLKSSRR
jgi:hypothetical protein